MTATMRLASIGARLVQDFAAGDRDHADLLGGKGANLAEMVRLGLPVPPGFTITTEACRLFLARGVAPAGLDREVGRHLERLEQSVGRRLGDPGDPLLVSVRSGARNSMPGMMETVLDVGLNDESVLGLAHRTGDERFAWDSYRRLLQMFGSTVLGVDPAVYATAFDAVRKGPGTPDGGSGPDAAALRDLVGLYQRLTVEHSGQEFPQDPRTQLDLSVDAVFRSWNTERAMLYRRRAGIPGDLGTAVNVQAMVFGNRGSASGSGVCFTRDPATGAPGTYGDYLTDAQGEDVVAGIRNTMALTELGAIDPQSYEQLLASMRSLELHYSDLCDIEFTIEEGTLWILQTRVGKRTAEAAFRIAVDMVDEGLIDLDTALLRVDGEQLSQLMFPCFDAEAPRTLLTTGINASPGAAVGRVALDSATAVAWAAEGQDVVLLRKETTPDDLPGMFAACGVLTTRGGRTSHAAVVARGMGLPCVCGADGVVIDQERREARIGDVVLAEGDVLSIDGATGEVFAGRVEVSPSPVMRSLDGEQDASSPVVRAVARLLAHADDVRRLGVRANADTPTDALRAGRLGAAGIGLCRTEHMFLGERRILIERLVLAENDAERKAALASLLPVQREDFVGVLRAMDGQPVTVRLLDPPLHEFLPDLTDLAVRVALAEAAGRPDEHEQRLLAAVRRLHEQNPMLGLRGVRLGIMVPGLFELQTRALLEATAELIEAGHHPQPEIMIPLVADEAELALVRASLEGVVAEVAAERSVSLQPLIGTMIEVPRAALTADAIAHSADFFSFGTNDLTQLTWGFSRDDVEAAFLPTYLDRELLSVSPFESLDVDGVGALVRLAVERGRLTRPDLHLGVCGEHGGDPASVRFFHEVGLDYVSCSPFRIPVARLESGRAALGAR